MLRVLVAIESSLLWSSVGRSFGQSVLDDDADDDCDGYVGGDDDDDDDNFLLASQTAPLKV